MTIVDALIIAVCILLSGAWVPLLALKGLPRGS